MVLVLLPLLGPILSKLPPTNVWELSHFSEAESFSTVRSFGFESRALAAKEKEDKERFGLPCFAIFLNNLGKV